MLKTDSSYVYIFFVQLHELMDKLMRNDRNESSFQVSAPILQIYMCVYFVSFYLSVLTHIFLYLGSE